MIGGILSVIYRPDGSWDLQNYHLYNAFAFIKGRFSQDLLPVGIQTYLNPILDIPYYVTHVGALSNYAYVSTFLSGLPYGILIFLILQTARILLPDIPRASAWEGIAAALIGLTGTATLSEVGTTFNDISIAIIVIFGLNLELKSLSISRWRGWPIGLLLGLSFGLKLTAAVYAPAALVAIMLTADGWRDAWRLGIVFCLAWWAGFLVADGWWALALWERFRNPIFPLFNNIFHSAWAAAASDRDSRFRPHGWLHVVFYPFYWLSGRSDLVSELPFRDARFAASYISIVMIAVMFVVDGAKSFAGLASACPAMAGLSSRKLRFIWIFFVISFVFWEKMFSIIRYAVPLEVLTGFIVWTGIRLAAARFGDSRFCSGMAQGAFGVLAIAVFATAMPMDWGRLAYGTPFVMPPVPRLGPGTTVLIVGKPLGFVLPFLDAPHAAFISIPKLPPHSPGRAFVRARLGAGGPVSLLTNADPQGLRGLLGPYGLSVGDRACRRIRNPFGQKIELCRLSRIAPA